MKFRPLLIASTLVAAGLVSGTAHAALQTRVGGVVPHAVLMDYDDVLDVTWAGFAYGYSGWESAVSVAAASTYGGSSTWRLPTLSELASLHNTLTNEPGAGFSSTFPLLTFGVGSYWSSEAATSDTDAWFFQMGASFGFDPQTSLYIYNTGNAYQGGHGGTAVTWVMSGDVAAIPEADTWTMLLAGLGLVGLAVQRRRG